MACGYLLPATLRAKDGERLVFASLGLEAVLGAFVCGVLIRMTGALPMAALAPLPRTTR